MSKILIQLVSGTLVIFFAGMNYPLYAKAFIEKRNIKIPWLRTILGHILNSFPGFCLIFLAILIINKPSLSLGIVLGLILINFTILAGFLIKKGKGGGDSFALILTIIFMCLLTFSLKQGSSFGFLKVGWAPIFMLASYIVYLKFFPLNKAVETEKLAVSDGVIHLRFFLASLLIMGGASQVVYAFKEIIKNTELSPLIGSFILAPIASLPKLPSLWSKMKPFDASNILESNLLILGIFVFLIDFFYAQQTIFKGANPILFYLSLEAMAICLLYLGAVRWIQYRKLLSSVVVITYLGSIFLIKLKWG
jgi:hypothetical protein